LLSGSASFSFVEDPPSDTVASLSPRDPPQPLANFRRTLRALHSVALASPGLIPMDQYEQPLEGLFRDGIPAPVLRAFAPMYQAIPRVQKAVERARDCQFWRASPLKCVDEDLSVVTSFMQASETSFRLCPQESASLLKCHHTEPQYQLFWCRDEEWDWRSCLMEKTGIRFWPYANAAKQVRFSGGGQTEDFHMEDRHFTTQFSLWGKKAASGALRDRELEMSQHRKAWQLKDGKTYDATFLDQPVPTVRPANLPPGSV